MNDAAHHMRIGKCENARYRRDETAWLTLAAGNGVTPDRFVVDTFDILNWPNLLMVF